jgi:hypothetical protein
MASKGAEYTQFVIFTPDISRTATFTVTFS